MLTNDFKDNHKEIVWKEIINMRHILVHGYYQVDSSIVWSTIVNDLPILSSYVDAYIKELVD